MSLQLVDTWIASTIRHPVVAKDATRLFYDAAQERVEATLLVSAELTNNGRSCLARWTGHELVVVQLSPRQQFEFHLEPGAMVRHLGFPKGWTELPAVRQVTLSEFIVQDALRRSGWHPLRGTCRFAVNDDQVLPFAGCALRLQYFRPDFTSEVTTLCHLNWPVGFRDGALEFTFASLYSDQNPQQVVGPTFLFLQLLTSHNWSTLQDCRRVSNVVTSVIELVP